MKYRQLFKPKSEGVSIADAYTRGGPQNSYTASDLTAQKPTTVFDYDFRGRTYNPLPRGWRTTPDGMRRVEMAERIEVVGSRIRYRQYLSDYPVTPINNLWQDTGIAGFSSDKRYIVETSAKVVQRCLLMTTDPGDLVLDPTCGSGTTAYVSEQWGRRWITIDTSRVAIAIARELLMTARFKDYQLRDRNQGVAAGFIYKTAKHISLRSIAQNDALDPIFRKHEAILRTRLDEMNATLAAVPADIRAKSSPKIAGQRKTQGPAIHNGRRPPTLAVTSRKPEGNPVHDGCDGLCGLVLVGGTARHRPRVSTTAGSLRYCLQRSSAIKAVRGRCRHSRRSGTRRTS